MLGSKNWTFLYPKVIIPNQYYWNMLKIKKFWNNHTTFVISKKRKKNSYSPKICSPRLTPSHIFDKENGRRPQSSSRDNLKDIKTTIHGTLNFIPHEPRKRLHCKTRKIFVTFEQGQHRIHGIEVITIALRHRIRRNTKLSGLTFYLYVALRPRCFDSDGKKR